MNTYKALATAGAFFMSSQRRFIFVMLMIDRIHRSSQCSAKLNDLGGVNVLHTMFPSCSYSSVLPHTPLLKTLQR